MATYYYDHDEDIFKLFKIGMTSVAYLIYITDKDPKSIENQSDKDNKILSFMGIKYHYSFYNSDINITNKNLAKQFIIEFENRDVKYVTINLSDAIHNYGAKKIDCYSLLSLLPDIDLNNAGNMKISDGIHYTVTKIIEDVENGVYTYFEGKYYKTNHMVTQLIFYFLFLRNDLDTLDIFLNFIEFDPEFIISRKLILKNYLSLEQFGKIIFYQEKNIKDNYLEFTKKLLPKFRTKTIDIMEELGIMFLPSDDIIPSDYIFTEDDFEYFVLKKIGTDHLIKLIITHQLGNYNKIPWLIENKCKPISEASELDMLIWNVGYSDYKKNHVPFEQIKEIIDAHVEIIDGFDTSKICSIGLLCIEYKKSLKNFLSINKHYKLNLECRQCYKEVDTTAHVIYTWASMEKNEDVFHFLCDSFTSNICTEFINFFLQFSIETYGVNRILIVNVIEEIFSNIKFDSIFDNVCNTIGEMTGSYDPFNEDNNLHYFLKYLNDEYLEYLYVKCCDNYNEYCNHIHNYITNGHSDIVKKYARKSISSAINLKYGSKYLVGKIIKLTNPSEWITDEIIESYLINVNNNDKNDIFILWCKNNIPEKFNDITKKIYKYQDSDSHYSDDDNSDDDNYDDHNDN